MKSPTLDGSALEPSAVDPPGQVASYREPTLLGAVLHRRSLVAAAVLLAVIVAVLYQSSRPETWVAQTSLVVRDPRTTSPQPETPNAAQAVRYVSDQVEILQSAKVIALASELPEAQGPPPLSALDLALGTTVIGRRESNVIELQFKASSEAQARAGASAIVAAYQRVRKDETTADYTSALQRIDSSIAAIDSRLEAIEKPADPGPADKLQGQLRQASGELATLLQQSPGDPSIGARIAQLRSQLELADLLDQAEQRSADKAAAEQERTRLIDRRAELSTQRDEISVQAELASGGVVLPSTPDQIPVSQETKGWARTLALALVLGGLLGSAIAYALDLRQRTLTNRFGPSTVLSAPLLADVPDFETEGVTSGLPTRDAPASASARAFQMAAASLEIVSSGQRVVAVVAALPGQGATATVANLAFAAARQGRKVLVVDADFESRGLTRALLDEPGPIPGLAELCIAGASLDEVARDVDVDGGRGLKVVSAGGWQVVPASLFRQPTTAGVFQSFRVEFDLVLVDVPSLGEHDYASLAVQQADTIVPVVAHDSPSADFDEFVHRLGVLQMPVVGYVYTRLPSRPSGLRKWRQRQSDERQAAPEGEPVGTSSAPG